LIKTGSSEADRKAAELALKNETKREAGALLCKYEKEQDLF